ncbi:MAG: hypothetical protein ACE5F6_03420 [Anaerolineae bacterium]
MESLAVVIARRISQIRYDLEFEVDVSVRPFGVRDIVLIRTLQTKGISLDLEGAVLRPRAPLWNALLSQIPLNSFGAATYVVRNRSQSGFIQAHQGRSPAEGYLTFVAPALAWQDGTSHTWQLLLETLCRGQGERGVQRIFAKLPIEADSEAEVFRTVGFRVYTQEHIFKLPRPTEAAIPSSSLRLRAWESKDAWGIHRLYCLGAPRFVQQAEHLPGQIGGCATSDWAQSNHEERYVWDQNGEVAAYLRLLGGEDGHWLHLLLHPEHTDQAEDLIRLGVARLETHAPRPVYCAVRTYEAGLASALEATGFEHQLTRFLLVKQTTVQIPQKIFEPMPQVEGVEAAPTASARMSHVKRRDGSISTRSEVLNETQ